jgi:NitT/TauT family transport system permease protein
MTESASSDAAVADAALALEDLAVVDVAAGGAASAGTASAGTASAGTASAGTALAGTASDGTAAASRRPGAGAGASGRLRAVLLGLILPVALIGCWELVSAVGMFSAALVPPPWTVLRTLGDWAGVSGNGRMFYDGKLFGDIWATLVRVGVGFALAAVIGCALGTAIGVSRVAEQVFTPLLRILGPMPPITWIPVAIVVLGLGARTNYFLTFLGAVFPIVAATAVAVSSVGRDLLRAGRMMGHRQLGLISSVVLPFALPSIVGGLRIGLGLSWMMAVTSEMLAVHSGLGYTLWNAYNYLDYPAVFAAMAVTGLCGLATDALLLALTRRATRWHAETGVRS